MRDRLNGSLLINFWFFSPSRHLTLCNTQVERQRISHSSTGPNMSEWGERYLNDSMSSSISLPFLVHIYCSGWKYWRGRGGGDLTQHAPCYHECFIYEARKKREYKICGWWAEVSEYVSNRSPDQLSFSSSTQTMWRETDKHTTRKGKLLFFYYTALHREASPFFFRLAILHERKSLLLKLSVERVMS